MIRVLWPGRTKNPELRRLIEEYVARIRRLTAFEVVETKDGISGKSGSGERVKAQEAAYLKKAETGYLVCLSDRGREMTSEEFGQWIRKRIETGSQPLTFIIGGYAGIDDRLSEEAAELLALSRMTLSHELSRLVLLEQIYRSLTQMKGWPYAK
ncbi:MAG: 23S rRNA (pseudouridine(1915)-N(3))-methyltransferase RlmH [Candidatus Aminicenantales bacterium]